MSKYEIKATISGVKRHYERVKTLALKIGRKERADLGIIEISALLHDVVEDTTKNEQEIKDLSEIILEKFGENVLLTVLEVSDNKSLPVEERKRLQIIHTPELSDRAKKLKIADKICNILDIKKNPPESWSLERKLRYLDWAKEVVAGAKGFNKKLDQYFDQVYDETFSYLRTNS